MTMEITTDQIFAMLGEKTLQVRLLENELERYGAEITRLETELQRAVLPPNASVEVLPAAG